MTCPSCGTDSRSCKNCRFYSPGSVYDCAERVEEPVKEKDRANFCDHFQLNPAFRCDHPVKGKISGTGASGPSASAAASSGRSAFEDLFKS